MSTLKQMAERILQEKEEKISMGEFPNTQTIFNVTGTFEDLRNGGQQEAVENPKIADMPADECLEVVSNLDTNDVVVNSMTDIYTKVGYGPLAREIGLTADKLKQGEAVLGIDGTVTPGIDTSDATATSSDIVEFKTAYVDGQKIDGSIIVPSSDGYEYADNVVTTLEGNNTVVMKGEAGTYDRVVIDRGINVMLSANKQDVLTAIGGADTSDATADENDIAMGKTAYVKGVKVTGAIPVYDEITYTDMTASVGTKLGDKLEIIGTMGDHDNDTIILKPNAKVQLTPTQSDIASVAGLTANKLKYGETVLGVVGTYQSGEIKTQIDYAYNTIIVHCGVIVNALTSAINEGKIDANYKLDLSTSGISNMCLKLCDVAPSKVLIQDTGTILTGCLGLAVNLENSYTALIFLDGGGEAKELGALDNYSSSPYYTSDMTVGDLVAALGSIGDVEINIGQDVIDSAWVYNEFRVIYYYFLNDSNLTEMGLLETTNDSMEIGEV